MFDIGRSCTMGLFSYLNNGTKMAEEEAERWDARKICKELQRTSSMTKAAGYAQALKKKCQDMNEWELKDVFDEAYNSKNVKACGAMMPVMSARGFAYKDSNGRIMKNY